MLTGMLAGLLLGLVAVRYFGVTDWLAAFSVIASTLMLFQLLGSTIGATIGKPHDDI